MATIANTTLPEDFVEQVLNRLQEDRNAEALDVQDAILAVLHRPLTRTEKWAIIDQASKNSPGVTLDQNVIDRIARGGRD